MEVEITIPETRGTLDLKIARLEARLRVLRQQQSLSRCYPGYHAGLLKEHAQSEAFLNELIRRRQQLLAIPLAI